MLADASSLVSARNTPCSPPLRWAVAETHVMGSNCAAKPRGRFAWEEIASNRPTIHASPASSDLTRFMMSSLVVMPLPPCFRSMAVRTSAALPTRDETWFDEPERPTAGMGRRRSARDEAHVSIVDDGRAMISHQRLDPDRIEPPAGEDQASGRGVPAGTTEARDHAVDIGFDVDPCFGAKLFLTLGRRGNARRARSRTSEVIISRTFPNATSVASAGTKRSSSGPSSAKNALVGKPT